MLPPALTFTGRSNSVLAGPLAAAACKNLLEIQMLEPTAGLQNQEIWVGKTQQCAVSPPDDSGVHSSLRSADLNSVLLF